MERQLLLTDKFFELSTVFINEKSYFSLVWKESTVEMTDEEYKNQVLLYKDFVEQTQPFAAYINTQKFLYTIDPQTQDWINTNIFPATVEAGLCRMAILISEDFFGQLSVEQTMTKNPELGFSSCFFEDEQKAIEWLLS